MILQWPCAPSHGRDHVHDGVLMLVEDGGREDNQDLEVYRDSWVEHAGRY